MEKKNLLQEADWLNLQSWFGSAGESAMQLCRAGKGRVSGAADNSSEE